MAVEIRLEEINKRCHISYLDNYKVRNHNSIKKYGLQDELMIAIILWIKDSLRYLFLMKIIIIFDFSISI